MKGKLQRLKIFFRKAFKRGPITEVASTAKVHKDIKEMNDLQVELSALKTGYNNAITEKESELASASFIYNDAYETFSELHRKHRLGIESKGKVKAERHMLKPLELTVNDLTDELNTIRQYKQDDIYQVLSHMQYLQDDYLKAKASEMKAVANQLHIMKLEYDKKLKEYGVCGTEVFEVEQVMKAQLNQYGFPDGCTMGDKFTILMQGVPTPADFNH